MKFELKYFSSEQGYSEPKLPTVSVLEYTYIDTKYPICATLASVGPIAATTTDQ